MLKRSEKKDKINFVFQDHSGKRWPAVWSMSLLIVIFLSVVVSVIGVSLVNNPYVPSLDIEETQKTFSNNEPLQPSSKGLPVLQFNKQKTTAKINKNEIYGFYSAGDDLSKQSLKENSNTLGVLIPDWYSLQSETKFKVTSEKKTDAFAAKHHIKVIPRLYLEDGLDLEILHKLLQSPQSRTNIINSLYNQVRKNQYAGVNIDFRGIDEEDRDQFTSFTAELYRLFHADGLEVTLTVVPDDPAANYAELAKTSDRMIVMYFDEHHELSEPGPVASVNWSQKILQQLPIPAEKLVPCLGNFGYEWKVGSKQPAKYMDFSEIMDQAQEARLKTQWDQGSKNPYMRFKKMNEEYIVWFLDAATSYNQIKIATGQGAAGVAIQQIGYEDPGIWKLISDTSKMEANVMKLKTMENPVPIVSIGSGEFIKVIGNSQKGSRTIQIDENQLISGEEYVKYPTPYFVKRYGYSENKEVAITFDDGPNPAYTPKILDILSEKHVPATFFVLGKNAALHPKLLERAYLEGHEIGSHTFNHTNITKDDPLVLQMEMNSTQRIIQQATGHSTTLFRPPYTTDAEYHLKDLNPIIKTQDMGYTMVGALIDTRDWETTNVNLIVERVMNSLSDGNVILLHDSGGDRTATIQALPKIIDELHNRGYKIVPTAQLVGKSPAEAMPSVQESSSTYMTFYKIADSMLIVFTKFCLVFFSVGIGFGLLRMLFLLFYSYKHKRNSQKREKNSDFAPSVSVIIPAYNEEKVIENTLHSILKSDYPHFQILVVDDGSSDKTANVVANAFVDDPKVRLIRKPNGGKSSAINKGVFEADGEIIVILDADTSIAQDTLSLLADHFVDERVAAVSGNVKIGNVRNLLTLWQHVEYVTGFNLEKRAFSELNCIPVVPGAIGAWRKNAILEAGGFNEDTLAEDTDITLKLLRKGHKITAEPKAYAYTEAPEDLKGFMKQRFRWSYGILQCLWKHRGALFNRKQKTLGFISLPNMWSQYVFSALAPLADLLFLFGLFGDSTRILTYYLAFFLVDLIVSVYALKIEGVSTKPLLLLILQRFIYRQLLTFTVWKSFAMAAKGVLVGWNKLQRSGNVTVPAKIGKGA